MADSLFELLLSEQESPSQRDDTSLVHDSTSTEYLSHLSTLPLSALTSSELQSLSQASHSLLVSLQALSTRSHRAIIASCDHLSTLSSSLSSLAEETGVLQDAIPKLDEAAMRFSQSYTRDTGNVLLERRKKAMLLTRNVDRLSDMLDLPSLLSMAISSSAPSSNTGTSQATGFSSGTSGYSSALDLYLHIKRLHNQYPRSPLVTSLMTEAEGAMQRMTVNLINGLKAPGLKLAGAMRMIGWLRRVAPELDNTTSSVGNGGDGAGLGALFLVCRLANLRTMLEALDPLRDLADQESDQRYRDVGEKSGATKTSDGAWSAGQHTERYLKRYIEIFREQSFAILSMYRSIFPSPTPGTQEDQLSRTKLKPRTSVANPALNTGAKSESSDPLLPLPSPVCTVPLHLVSLLTDVLKRYLPNIQDRASRESLLTQVLYCAGSLGRLGADFSLILASVDLSTDGENSIDWANVMKKHRALAGRLDQLASR